MPMLTMQSETGQRRKSTNRTTNTITFKPWYVAKYVDPFRALPMVGIVLEFLGFSPSRIAQAECRLAGSISTLRMSR